MHNYVVEIETDEAGVVLENSTPVELVEILAVGPQGPPGRTANLVLLEPGEPVPVDTAYGSIIFEKSGV